MPGTPLPIPKHLPLRRSSRRSGWVLLVALMIMAVLAVIGSTTLQTAGIDQRIALHNRKHVMMLNTAHAGIEHARYQLETTDPEDEGLDTASIVFFVDEATGEAAYESQSYAHNMGNYRVQAIYQRCGPPPPGFSAELGEETYRSDYWELASEAATVDGSMQPINETFGSAAMLARRVVRGACKLR